MANPVNPPLTPLHDALLDKLAAVHGQHSDGSLVSVDAVKTIRRLLDMAYTDDLHREYRRYVAWSRGVREVVEQALIVSEATNALVRLMDSCDVLHASDWPELVRSLNSLEDVFAKMTIAAEDQVNG
jgi:hypothetical protein